MNFNIFHFSRWNELITCDLLETLPYHHENAFGIKARFFLKQQLMSFESWPLEIKRTLENSKRSTSF